MIKEKGEVLAFYLPILLPALDIYSRPDFGDTHSNESEFPVMAHSDKSIPKPINSKKFNSNLIIFLYP